MTGAEYIQGLRDFADWLEQNQDALADDLAYQAGKEYQEIVFFVARYTPEKFAEAVKLLGRGEKRPDENYFNVDRVFGPIRVQVYAPRETVCRKIVKGTREITREIPDPDALDAVPKVTVTETVEDVEWICEEPILAAMTKPEVVA